MEEGKKRRERNTDRSTAKPFFRLARFGTLTLLIIFVDSLGNLTFDSDCSLVRAR